MNGRAVPWRKKAPQEIQDTFEDASQLKLYLLQEIGPTSFVFKDESENKYKVVIGHEVSCSCSPHRKDHCIHTLYVCFKIFKLEKENPLCWQASYIDSEIADLIRFRYNPSGAQKPKKIEKFLKKSVNTLIPKDNSKNNRQALGEDDMCPICHEDLSEEEGTTFCKKGCGNNFHIKCALIWAEHRHKIGDKISCPMCRCDWGTKAYEGLVKEFQDFESRLITHKGHKCGGCKGTKPKSIRGKLFKCVYCENVELCEKCFQNFEHFEHHRYLMKENINAEWKPAMNRDRSLINSHQKNSMDVFNEIMGHGNFNLNNPMISMNHQYNRGFQRPGEISMEGDTTENFLLSCFPDLNGDLDILNGKSNNLTIFGHDVKKNCSCCHTDRVDVSRLKRLNCGHVMHGHCLLEMIGNKNFKCPDDSVEFLKGYKTACFPRENPAPINNNTVSEKIQQQQKVLQNSGKLNKKPIEEQKTNRNNVRLGPLELDIKGKGVSASNDNAGSPMRFEVDSLFKPKAQSAALKQARKPPAPSKGYTKANSNTLPPLFEIQGTNLNNEQQPQLQQQPQPHIQKSSGRINKKPLMPVQQNNLNNSVEKSGPLVVGNFRIVPSIKVQPKNKRKTVNPASLKGIARNREEETEVVSNDRRYPMSSNNLGENELGEQHLTDFEEVDENY